MKVCIIGTGYVGLVTGAGLAEMGNDVTCVDLDIDKIHRLNLGECPIYEPGLPELLASNANEGRLKFTTDLYQAVQESAICMIAVGTPQELDGSANLDAVYAVAKSIAKSMNEYKVVTLKSTVPVGTCQAIKEIIEAETNFPVSVVSNPEFLKQGDAVDDFLEPDRVIIGTEANDNRAREMMQELYSPFLKTANPMIFMSVKSAEMAKYTANAFLATKISFINEMAMLCEKLGADISEVRTGLASDSRIGPQFLFPGLGFGGSCFPKDIRALIQNGENLGVDLRLIKEVDNINKRQRTAFVEKIFQTVGRDLSGKTIAVWGLAFKPRTDDMREAPSIDIINALLNAGAIIQAFDPKAIDTAKKIFDTHVDYTKNAYDALENADFLLLLTEWNEFRRPDFDRIKQMLKQPLIFDGRNQYDPQRMAERGFTYISIGRQTTATSALPELQKL